MSKAILMSLLVASIVLPVRAARARSERVALRRLVLWCVLFNVFYAFAVVVLYPRFL